MRFLNFMAGVLIGVFVGASIILLTTPQSGQDTQQQFAERLDKLLAEGKKAFSARKEELETRMAGIKAGNSI